MNQQEQLEEILLLKDPLQRKEELLELIPELHLLIGVTQAPYHQLDVFDHTMRVVQAIQNDLFHLKLAALFHDIGKPLVKSGTEEHTHFYRHEDVGAELAQGIIHRFGYSEFFCQRIVRMVQLHMRFNRYQPDQWSDVAVMKLVDATQLSNGRTTLYGNILLAVADCSSDKHETLEHVTERLMHFLNRANTLRFEQDMKKNLFLQSPLNGHELMQRFHLTPGPIVGQLKRYLADQVAQHALDATDMAAVEKTAQIFLLSSNKESQAK